MPGLAGPHGESDGEVGLPGAGRAEEDHVLLGGDEVEGAEVGNLVAAAVCRSRGREALTPNQHQQVGEGGCRRASWAVTTRALSDLGSTQEGTRRGPPARQSRSGQQQAAIQTLREPARQPTSALLLTATKRTARLAVTFTETRLTGVSRRSG